MTPVPNMKLAILDDYQRVTLKMADWSHVAKRYRIDVIDRPLRTVQEAIQTLRPYDIICMLRERTAAPRELIEGLPNLKLLAITGPKHRTLDLQAATEHGVLVCNSPVPAATQFGTPELAIALMLASVRRIPQEERRLREGHWQTGVGMQVYGRTLGIVGLGGIGSNVARMAQGLNMQVIAWSQNLTSEAAAKVGVRRVEKDELFTQADIISMHLVLGDRTRGIVGARELSLMKPTAFIINTARAPLIDESALLEALQNRTIAGAALDVYWEEPIPRHHPFCSSTTSFLLRTSATSSRSPIAPSRRSGRNGYRLPCRNTDQALEPRSGASRVIYCARGFSLICLARIFRAATTHRKISRGH
jgi:phosphoglycerate dehydrogenase-like enzyme